MEEGKVNLISASRNTKIASHCFYADDLMVYCKGKMSSLESFKYLFTRYANFSDQSINLRKFYIHGGGINRNRLNNNVDLLASQ